MVTSEDYKGTTYKQGQRWMDVGQEIAPTRGKLQRLFESTDVLKAIAGCPDRSRVDIAAVINLFKEPFTDPDWVSYDDYVPLIQARAQLRGWEFAEEAFDQLSSDVQKGAARYLHERPIPGRHESVEIWLGVSIQYNWDEMTSWLADSLESIGMKLEAHVDATKLAFAGSRPHYEPFMNFDYVPLDKDGEHSVYYRIKRRFDVLVLLAMNPEVCREIGSKLPPRVDLNGYVTNDGGVPTITRKGDTVFIELWKETEQ